MVEHSRTPANTPTNFLMTPPSGVTTPVAAYHTLSRARVFEVLDVWFVRIFGAEKPEDGSFRLFFQGD